METPAVEFRDITKRFPGVTALHQVSVAVASGACHALVGENGAGKSTLGKILAGVHEPDGGRLLLDGREVHFTSPYDAIRAGVGMVHQELAFCENLSVAENLCLGQLPSTGPFLSRARMIKRAREWLDVIGANIDPTVTLGELTIGQQQLVQIATAVGRGARVLIFDEPTSSLSQKESERLFDLIRRLQEQGVTSLYVSHRLEEVFDLCDTITVLRDGEVVGTGPARELDERSLVQMMIGRSLETYYPSHLEADLGDELLRVEGLTSAGRFSDVWFTLRAGEVLGFAGLVGSGRTEVGEALFGLGSEVSGRIYIQGKPVSIDQPATAMKHGLGLVPEDRKRHGLVLSMSARANLSLPTLERHARLGWVRAQAEEATSRDFFAKLRIKAPSGDTVTATLSGGNQQKIVLAKWLAAQCRILILDEPTRGVDVGAKAEMHLLIDQLARDGSAIILISSELPEVLNLSTRILVFRDGAIVGELNREEADQERVVRLMAGLGA